MSEITEKSTVTDQLKSKRKKEDQAANIDKRDVMVVFEKDFHCKSPEGGLLHFPAEPEPQPVPWNVIPLVEKSKTAHAEIKKNQPEPVHSPVPAPVQEEAVKTNEQSKSNDTESKLGSPRQDSGSSKK